VLFKHLPVPGDIIYSIMSINLLILKSSTIAWPDWPSHTHWLIILSHNLITEIQKKLTSNKVGTNCFYSRYNNKNSYLVFDFSGDAGAVTISLSESEFYMVIRFEPYILWSKLTGWAGVAITLCNQLGTASGMRDTMILSAWRISEPSLIWLLPCGDVTRGIWDCPRTIS